MVRWLRRCIRLRSDVSEVRFLPGPRRADVLETGDFSGDKLGGLTDSGDEAVTSGHARRAGIRRFSGSKAEN